MPSLRAIIARQFSEIAYQGASANRIIGQLDRHLSDPRDLAFARECLFGSARHYEKLNWILSQLLQKPLKTKEIEIRSLLITGIYQLLFLDTPPHAVISESVHASRQLKKNWASGLVNAVLRNTQRQGEKFLTSSKMPEHVSAGMPLWLMKRLKKAWPNDWLSICEFSNQKAPMTLRVNESHPKFDQYEYLLKQANIEFERNPSITSAIKLQHPCNVYEIPEFDSGLFSVQDLSAQLAAWLLPVEPEAMVLDACAAPGGKTAHLLERYSNIQLTALELDSARAEKIQQNLSRIGVSCQVEIADASQWQSSHLLDAVLLDAPCSATGVIRRQPDIKLHRREEDIIPTVQLQSKLLNHLWQQIKPGGHLLYATCSVLPDENQHQISAFVNTHPEAKLLEFPVNISQLGIKTNFGLQILPSHWNDGFFYCLMQKSH